jgi:hypothetical protein
MKIEIVCPPHKDIVRQMGYVSPPLNPFAGLISPSLTVALASHST